MMLRHAARAVAGSGRPPVAASAPRQWPYQCHDRVLQQAFSSHLRPNNCTHTFYASGTGTAGSSPCTAAAAPVRHAATAAAAAAAASRHTMTTRHRKQLHLLHRTHASTFTSGVAAAAPSPAAAAAAAATTVAPAGGQSLPLNAKLRAKAGKQEARRCRRAQRVPGVIFTPRNEHDKVLISIADQDLETSMHDAGGERAFMNTVFTLTVRSSRVADDDASATTTPNTGDNRVVQPPEEEEFTFRVLPQLLHRHPVSDVVHNLTFLEFSEERYYNVDVPVVIRGETVCQGVLKGGVLIQPTVVIPVRARGDSIPKRIVLDASTLPVGAVVRLVGDVPLPPNCELRYPHREYILATVKGSRRLMQQRDSAMAQQAVDDMVSKLFS